MVCSFIALTEYQQRFSSVLTHSKTVRVKGVVMNGKAEVQIRHFLLFITFFFAALTFSVNQVSAQTLWKLGDRVEVEWKGDWYQAEVIEVKGNQYKIHYQG